MACNKHHESGYSVVELLVVSTLGVFLAGQIFALLISIQVSSYIRHDIVQSRHALSAAFLNRNFCTCNFKGLQWNTTDSAATINIPKLDTFTSDTAACVAASSQPWFVQGQVVAQTNYPNSITVNDIRLEGMKAVGSNRYLADLVVSVSGVSSNMSTISNPLRVSGVPLVVTPLTGAPDVVEVTDCDFSPFDPQPLMSDSYSKYFDTPNATDETFKSVSISAYPEARRVMITNSCKARGPGAEVLTYVRFLRNGTFLGEKYYGCNVLGPHAGAQSMGTDTSFTAILPLGADEIRMYIKFTSTTITWPPALHPYTATVMIDLLR